ncbi:MAG: serine/threonine protein kinase [Cyanobacterium sp. T60_A2020_053]|nr:serine/threonine protein kinase [Cyanobacterium sp. T60_A2020_053]
MGMNTTTLLNNRYQITSTLGRGGFGETFLAIDTHLPSGKKCVIKLLKPIISSGRIPQWMYDRFEQEARLLEHLGDAHRQIPRLYAYFSEGNNFYLVQEWIEGTTLLEKVKKEGQLSPHQVEEILLNILPVLKFLHGENIVHRDVKPDNIIFRESDNLPVLIDFGAVKEALTTFVDMEGNSAYSIAIGTPGYMPSEQAAGRPIYSSDLYSLGLTAVYLLTGKSPQYLATDTDTGEILWREELPDLHSNLAGVIDRAIRFHPRERFKSANEMMEALQPISSAPLPTVSFQGVKVANQTISHDPTIAVGGRRQNAPMGNDATIAVGGVNHSKVSQIYRQNAPLTPTNGVNLSPQITDSPRESNWFSGFLPFLWLMVIGIASFTIGYNVIASRFAPAPEVTENNTPDTPEELFPPKNPLRRQIDLIIPQENPSPNPDTEIDNSVDANLEENPTSPQPEANIPETPPTVEETPPPENPPPSPIKNPPLVSVGGLVNQLMGRFGNPAYKEQGRWENTTVWVYPNLFNSTTEVRYTIHDQNGQVKEIDLFFPLTANIDNVITLFDRLVDGNVTPVVRGALEEVLRGETDLRSFNLGKWKGMIRLQDDLINLNIHSGDN